MCQTYILLPWEEEEERTYLLFSLLHGLTLLPAAALTPFPNWTLILQKKTWLLTDLNGERGQCRWAQTRERKHKAPRESMACPLWQWQAKQIGTNHNAQIGI